MRTLVAPEDRLACLADAIAQASVPVATGRRIYVVGAHGGAGATTVALCLAGLTARYRSDAVALLDASDAEGGLRTRLTAAPVMSVEAADRQLVDASTPHHTAMLRERGLHVFSPAAERCERVLDEVQRYAAVTFVDTDLRAGTLGGHPATAVVVVAENTVRGASAVRGCMRRLGLAGVTHDHAVVLVTERVAGSGVGRTWLRQQVTGAGSVPFFSVPTDRHLAGAAQVRLDLLAPATSMVLSQAAAAAVAASVDGDHRRLLRMPFDSSASERR